MPAIIIQIADAVVARINDPDSNLSIGLDAERAYVPVNKLEDLGSPRATVVPAGIEMTMLSRRDDDFDYLVDVGVQKKTDGSPDEVDALMTLVEEVVDLFRGRPLAFGDTSALCVAVGNAPIYDPDHLRDRDAFSSVARLTFRVARAR